MTDKTYGINQYHTVGGFDNQPVGWNRVTLIHPVGGVHLHPVVDGRNNQFGLSGILRPKKTGEKGGQKEQWKKTHEIGQVNSSINIVSFPEIKVIKRD